MAEKISVNDFRNGISFLYNEKVYLVLSSEHSKSGRGQAHVKVKVKNLVNKTTTMLTFTGGDKVEKAFIKKSKSQFIYREGNELNFMNNETFEQVSIPLKEIEWEAKFLVEGQNVLIISYEELIIGIELETNITLEVSQTSDATRGNTVSAATKKATVVTGIELDVPQFINIGDKIIISTETAKYVSKG